MSRHNSTDIIVLKSERFGEYHKNVTFLAEDQGIVRAVAYGAIKSKSKFAGITDPFCKSKAYLYHNPISGSTKISDMEVISLYPNIRQNLDKIYTSSTIAEVMIQTYGGGDNFKNVFKLLSDTLKIINECNDQKIIFVLIQFLLRYFIMIGFFHLNTKCPICSKEISNSNIYLSQDAEMICSNCSEHNSFSINQGSISYILGTIYKEFNIGVSINADKKTVNGILFMFELIIQNTLGRNYSGLKRFFKK